MRKRYSRLSDLRRLFGEAITVSTIAEPLAAFDIESHPEIVKQFMQQKRYDVVGVRQNGLVSGYLKEPKEEWKSLKSHKLHFKDGDLLPESAPLIEAINRLVNKERIFVTFLEQPSAIITRADLQKQAVRMWLFGLGSLVEGRMLALLRVLFPDESWTKKLHRNQLNIVKSLHARSKEKGIELELDQCLTFGNKRILLEGFVANSKRPTFDAAKLEALNEIRNDVAHIKPLAVSDWQNIASLARYAQEFIEEADNFLESGS